MNVAFTAPDRLHDSLGMKQRGSGLEGLLDKTVRNNSEANTQEHPHNFDVVLCCVCFHTNVFKVLLDFGWGVKF